MIENTELHKAEYWRNLNLKLLGWGIATAIIVMGWSMSEGEIFCFAGSFEYKVRAWLFTACIFVVGVFWIIGLNKLHKKATSIKLPKGLEIIDKKVIIFIAIAWLLFSIGVTIAAGSWCTDDFNGKVNVADC